MHGNKWLVDISDDVGQMDLIVMGRSVETIWWKRGCDSLNMKRTPNACDVFHASFLFNVNVALFCRLLVLAIHPFFHLWCNSFASWMVNWKLYILSISILFDHIFFMPSCPKYLELSKVSDLFEIFIKLKTYLRVSYRVGDWFGGSLIWNL
jgi:hypothetical protein